MKLLRVSVAFLSLAVSSRADSTPSQAETLEKIYSEALAQGKAYDNLTTLVTQFPGRLTGSNNLEKAIVWATKVLEELHPDRLEIQDVEVPHWVRGAPESVFIDGVSPRNLNAVALGFSGATPHDGLSAEVLEVLGLKELEALPDAQVKGKIVFFNRPMKAATVSPGQAYTNAVDQRSRGPDLASKKGAAGALVRSMTQRLDDVPHTGYTGFAPEHHPIPALALSTLAANQLHEALANDVHLRVKLAVHAQNLPPVISHNVIAELKGTDFPDQILLVGGHSDSWDIAPGAHDDGAGVCQAIEVLRLFQKLGIKPRHTLRIVLFVGEENSLAGANYYRDVASRRKERHLLALESDSGGFQPRAIQLGSATGPVEKKAARWLPLFEPYGITSFEPGGGGADVTPLLMQGSVIGELLTKSQRYFDIHHTRRDNIDQVNPRELHLGAATLASLIWLVDTEGF